MYQIRPWLYIGKYHETTDSALLRAHGIGAMLQLSEPVEHKGIATLFLPVEDGEPLSAEVLAQGVAFVRAQKAAGQTVLIACHAGISRSVTFATAALAEEEQMSLPEAFRAIQQQHPYALPHPTLWESLRRHFKIVASAENSWEEAVRARQIRLYPRLLTERLLLRRFELADAPDVQRLAGDPDIAATTLHIPHPYPDGAAAVWISNMHAAFEQGTGGFTFAITSRANSALLMGAISLHVNSEHRRAEMGYWIGKPYWGQGYASEAAQRLIRFGFEELNLNRIHASYFTTNPASARVMQKVGMKYEGISRQHIIKNGNMIDLGHYSLLRAEWDAAQEKSELPLKRGQPR